MLRSGPVTPHASLCGDAPCEPYSFIGNPVFRRHSVDEMREAFLSFFERNGHTRIERYPVVARWREDIYLTIASIADFQPYVTGGIVPPPANPLTISQPCIRLNDLDSVGRSGRHLTLFEMMAHHAFNTSDREVYWKDRTVELCDEFIASIGGDLNKVSYKEHPWFGGGNAGPSLEILIGGLEVATLVFMNLGRTKTEGPGIELNGELYYPMKIRIVDTGYGLERFVWASKGSPTIYDAVFPEMVSRVMESAGLAHLLDDKEYTKILSLNAKFAGLMDISGTNLYQLRKRVAATIDVPIEKLDRMITPIEKVYAVVDHTRCLAYMLGDCIVPSNVREGYLARLVIRRTLRMMNDLGVKASLGDLVEQQMQIIGNRNFEQDTVIIREIIDREVEKYASTLSRGTRIVQKIAKAYKSKTQRVPLKEVITLYDSHGIPPDIVRDIATKEGAVVDLPDNFYSLIADMHSEAAKETAPVDRFATVCDPHRRASRDEKTLLRAALRYRVRSDGHRFLRRVRGNGPDTLLPGRRRPACRHRDADLRRGDGQGGGGHKDRRCDPSPDQWRSHEAGRPDQGDRRRRPQMVAHASPHRDPSPPPCLKGGPRGSYPPGGRSERCREFADRYPSFQTYHPGRTAPDRDRGEPDGNGRPVRRYQVRRPDEGRADIRVLPLPGGGSSGQGNPGRTGSRRCGGVCRNPLPEHGRDRG